MSAKDPRPYIAVTNELFRHPKFIVLPDVSKLWLIELWAWCNEQKTDGVVPKAWALSKGKKVYDPLCVHGWIDPRDGNTVLMHDYLKHQKSRAELEALSVERKEAGKRGGLRSHHTRNHVKKGVFARDCEFCADLQEEPEHFDNG